MRNIKIFLLLLITSGITLVLSSCGSNELKLTTVAVEDSVRKYFPILQGERQNINVKVYNTGKEPLKIYDVYPSCGCTVAKFPKKLIPAGEYGTIEMEYNSNKNIGT